MLEEELYEPMRAWLEQYLTDKYKGHEIIVVDTHSERLDRALAKYDIVNEMANGVDIQIDVLGIARKQGKARLFFIEAKKTKLTLRDLGQLWSYCKLVDPEEVCVSCWYRLKEKICLILEMVKGLRRCELDAGI